MPELKQDVLCPVSVKANVCDADVMPELKQDVLCPVSVKANVCDADVMPELQFHRSADLVRIYVTRSRRKELYGIHGLARRVARRKSASGLMTREGLGVILNRV